MPDPLNILLLAIAALITCLLFYTVYVIPMQRCALDWEPYATSYSLFDGCRIVTPVGERS